MSWYYSERDEQRGPVERVTLEEMARTGRLRADQLVWNPEFGDQWRPAGEIPGLFPEEPTSDAPGPEAAEPPSPGEVVPFRGSQGPFVANAELTRRAREALTGNWGLGVAVTLIHLILTQVLNNVIPIIGPLATLLITGPLTVGLSIVYLRISRRSNPEVGQLFEGFAVFGNALGVYLLTALFVLLWFFLLIIPGIIAAIAYSQVYYLLADHPGLSPIDAIRNSRELMRGHKWQYFCLGWRFFGWMILCMFTLGIGLLWLIPYMQTAYTEFYLELRAHQKQSQGECS